MTDQVTTQLMTIVERAVRPVLATKERKRGMREELLSHVTDVYDDELSRVFFDELGVPAPDCELNAGGGSNTEQTARILGLLEGVIGDASPDLVLVYGDTNSTLAGALAAAQARVPVAHVEAGMRSFDRAMPEELNRVLTDHCSDLLLCCRDDLSRILFRCGLDARFFCRAFLFGCVADLPDLYIQLLQARFDLGQFPARFFARLLRLLHCFLNCCRAVAEDAR